MKLRFHWTPLVSSLILPAFPHFVSYQLSPTGPSLSVVRDMAEQGCPGMEAAPQREDALLCRQKLPKCSYNTLPPAPMSSTSPMTGGPTCQLNSSCWIKPSSSHSYKCRDCSRFHEEPMASCAHRNYCCILVLHELRTCCSVTTWKLFLAM